MTGASSGIGAAIALRLASEGCCLYLLDIDQVGLARTADEAKRLGVEVTTCRCDISDKSDVAASVEQAVDRWAGVDILVNNAGITYYGAAHTTPDEVWERLIAVNLHGAVDLTRRLLPWMLARPRAHVLNVCSVLGLVGLPRVSYYSCSKFGLVGYSEALRNEYGRNGLGVTALCPGFVCTNLFSSAKPAVGEDKPRQPPAFMCTTPERVAKAGVRAIQRNRRKVVIEPCARVLHTLHHFAPGFIDWAIRFGEYKKVKQKQRRLDSLSDDPTEAIRLAVQPERRRAA